MWQALFVNVQRHYDAKGNLPQRLTSIKCRNRSPLQIKGSDSCARAQQVWLVVQLQGYPLAIALHESIAIACVPSVSDQNQLLPKPLCLGYLPDVPAPFVHNWAFAAQNLCIHCYFSANCGYA